LACTVLRFTVTELVAHLRQAWHHGIIRPARRPSGRIFACPQRLVIDIDGDSIIRTNIGIWIRAHLTTAAEGRLLNTSSTGIVKQLAEAVLKVCCRRANPLAAQEGLVKAAQADGFATTAAPWSTTGVPRVHRGVRGVQGPAFWSDDRPGRRVYPMGGAGSEHA